MTRLRERRYALILRPKLRAAAALVTGALTIGAVACGGGDGSTDGDDARALTIHNETDCNVHIRFDNGRPVAAVGPRSTQEYVDERLGEYRFMQVESTKAIFRNLDLAPIRENDWTVTIEDAFDDGECVDVPGAAP